MATLININGGMTGAGARRVGRRSSFARATYYAPGQEPVDVSMQVAPDLDPDRAVAYIGSLLDHPDIADAVRGLEKDALLLKKRQGAVESGIRDRRADDLGRREAENARRQAKGEAEVDPEGGAPYEWDHLVVSLDATETAWLAANPDRKEEFRRIVTEALRWNPTGPGERQALIAPVHEDTGHWHVNALVNRFAVDLSTTPPTVPPGIDMSRGGEMQKIVNRLNDAFREAGLPFRTIKTNDPAATTDGRPAQRSVFEDRRISDGAKEDYAEAVREQGGEPSAQATVGPIPDRPVPERIAERIVPTAEGLMRGKELAAAEGLRAAQDAQRLRQQLEAAETTMRAAAEREARFDEAVAAIAQKEAAEAAAAAEAEARQQAETAAAAAQQQAEALTAEIAAERDKVGKLEIQLAEASNAAAEANKQADDARQLAAERFATIEAMEEQAAGEPERQAEAVAEALAPVEADRDQARARLAEVEAHAAGEAERTAAAVAAALAPVQAEQARLAARLAEVETQAAHEREARRAAEAALESERAAIPGRITAAVEAAIAGIRATYDGMIARLEAQIAALLRRGGPEGPEGPGGSAPPSPPPPAGGPAGGSGGPAGGPAGPGAPGAAPGASTATGGATRTRARWLTGPGEGDDFFRVTPDAWTTDQRGFAEREFAARRKQNPAMAADVDAWGQAAHEAWQEKQQQQPKPRGPRGPRAR